MQDDDGVNFTALAALDTRARRRHFRPAAPHPGVTPEPTP
jgi:hypothetical protein